MKSTVLSFIFFILLPLNLYSQSNEGGVNLESMDTSVSPCTDFYQYACGNWIKNTEIPADENSFSSFNIIRDRNEAVLHDILVELENKPNRTKAEQKLGDFYHSCMNVSAEDNLTPLKNQLKDIDAIKTKDQLISEVAKLHAQGLDVLFSFGPVTDPENSLIHIAEVDEAGLPLPGTELYTKPNYFAIRVLYLAYMRDVMKYIGFSGIYAVQTARKVLTVESSLAKISISPESRRDPLASVHKMSLKQLHQLCPNINWSLYFEEMHTPKFSTINVAYPKVFVHLNALLDTLPLDYWKAYLKWQVIHDMGPLLSDEIEHKTFDFFGRTLGGETEEAPRWKQCVGATNSTLSDLLGKEYVDRQFNESSKRQIEDFITQIRSEMSYDINTNLWMSSQTKAKALIKLDRITSKIGYPNHWKTYHELPISRIDFIGNVMRATVNEVKRELALIGQPVDRTVWGMSPPTVNAYYSADTNSINFPAGILQPPLFDPNIDMAYNYGSMVAIIGHELTHGFDDQGRHFDGDGNLKDWWTQEDEEAFNKQAQGLIDQYSKYVVLEDPSHQEHKLRINGKLTLGENIADNGGLHLAYMAFLKHYKSSLKHAKFTARQRFFLGWAQGWCSVQTPEFIVSLTMRDPHALPKFRVDGTISNMEQFGEAFSCKEGTPMNPVNKNRVW
jgi:putative endopeptidase